MGDEEDVASRFRTPNVVQKFRRTFTRVIYPFSRSKDVANALVRARFRRSFFWFGFERDPRLARLLGLGYLGSFFFTRKRYNFTRAYSIDEHPLTKLFSQI